MNTDNEVVDNCNACGCPVRFGESHEVRFDMVAETLYSGQETRVRHMGRRVYHGACAENTPAPRFEHISVPYFVEGR